MEKVRVILVEDDIDVCKKFEAALLKFEDIEIIKYTGSATEAIGFIKKLTPDAIILDLELSDGEGSGLDVLKALHDTPSISKPYILVTTNNPSDVTQKITQDLGVDFTLKKYQTSYSEEQVLLHISLFKAHFLEKRKYSNESYLEYEQALDPQTPNNYKQKIFDELYKAGFLTSNKGYTYFLEAIDYVVADKDADFLKMLSKKHLASRDSIIKAMQRALNKAHDNYTCYILKEGKPKEASPFDGIIPRTISDVVHYYAEKIQL